MDKAKVFNMGNNQAVRLPKEIRFDCDELCIKRIGRMVVIFDPKDRRKIFLESLGKVTDDFMLDRRQPKTVERRSTKR